MWIRYNCKSVIFFLKRPVCVSNLISLHFYLLHREKQLEARAALEFGHIFIWGFFLLMWITYNFKCVILFLKRPVCVSNLILLHFYLLHRENQLEARAALELGHIFIWGFFLLMWITYNFKCVILFLKRPVCVSNLILLHFYLLHRENQLEARAALGLEHIFIWNFLHM